MKDYQFEYTRIRETLLIVILTMITFILGVVIGALQHLQIALTIVISLGLAVLVFRLLKRKAVHTCTANFNDLSVRFEFEQGSKIINFEQLTSYKLYYGKNGPALYLNSDVDRFQLSANSNFCKTDNFSHFCEDLLKTLDTFKHTRKPQLIRNQSVFATKDMLYFLLVATVVYLLSFVVETDKQKIAIGIGGGFYVFFMWTKYLLELESEN